MEDKCEKPDELTTADIFKNTQDLMKSMGADEKCVKAAQTWGSQASKSANFYARGSAEAGWGAAKVEAETGGGFQDSSQSFGNTMSESGCGTYVVNATKQSTNIKKIQCTIQKAQNTSEVGVSGTNTITFRTTALTPQEVGEKAKLLSDVNQNYVANIPRPKMDDYSALLLAKAITPQEAKEMLAEDQKQWANSRDSLINNITKSYSRDINFKNGSITQSIQGKIKILNSLSAQESQTIENAMKDISKAVAEQQLEQTAGLNASTPNSKSTVDVNIQKNENLSSTAINSKIQSIKQNIAMSNNLTVDIAGNINFDNVNINQSIILDVVAESLIASAISAGVKAATEIVTDTSTMNKMKTESKGVEDLVKAQGEANAAAINAGKVGPLGPGQYSTGFSSIIGVLAILYIIQQNPIIKYVLVGFIILFGLIIILNLNTLVYKAGTFMGIELNSPNFISMKMKEMKRSLAYYNKIWKSFGCTRELEYDDIMSLELEAYPNETIYEKMEQIFKQSLVPNARNIDLKLCFIDGKVPKLFLPLIKLKKPKDLTVEELRVIWTNVSNCPNTYFSDFVVPFKSDVNATRLDGTRKYSTYADVLREIDGCGINIIMKKSPVNLTDEDLKTLWIKYGSCDENKFASFVSKGQYKQLSTMNDVLNAIYLCDAYNPQAVKKLNLEMN
jgi:hypothetical protein